MMNFLLLNDEIESHPKDFNKYICQTQNNRSYNSG